MAGSEKAADLHSRRRHVRWGMGAVTVDSVDFMTRNEAADELEKISANWLVARGILERAFLEDGTEGVTVSSVRREQAWQRSASRWQRTRRMVAGLLQLPWMI